MKQKQLRVKIFKRLKDTLVSSYDQGTVEDGGILNGLECSKQITDFINDNCYGIVMSVGSWDDAYSWVEHVCFDEKEAREFVDNYNAKLDKLKNKLREELPKDENDELSYWDLPNYMRYDNIFERNEAMIRKLNLL